MERLFNDDEGTIVDSSGEYRVVFDIAGPQRDSLSQPQQTQSQPQQTLLNINPNPVAAVEKVASLLPGNANNDDFSIDEDVTDQEPPSYQDVTLVTHGDLLTAKKYLVPLVERWDGPVSLVLFATNSSHLETTLAFIAHVRLCSDEVRHHVNFHIVSPLVETHLRYTASNNGKRLINKARLEKQNKRPGPWGGSGSASSKIRRSSAPNKTNNNNYSSAAIIDLETECQYFQEQKESSKFYRNSRESSDPLYLSSSGGSVSISSSSNLLMGSSYPTNLLRNVGRKRVSSSYSLVIPLYMLPSEGLRSKFHRMVKRRKDVDEKTVFVIPSFETKNEETPKNKVITNYDIKDIYF